LEKNLHTNPGLLWFGNPNNPDGHIFNFHEINAALENHPNTLLIIDEAYADFINDFQSIVTLTKTHKNLIVVRSLTKCCAIPGLRLGYIVTSKHLAEKLAQFQQPWSVNALAQEAGKFLIGQMTEQPLCTQIIRKLSSDLQKAINRIDGFRVIPSKAPYFLIEMDAGKAAELKQFLLSKHGLLIRDASNFRGLNEQFFRVSACSEKDNQLLIKGLYDWNLNRKR